MLSKLRYLVSLILLLFLLVVLFAEPFAPFREKFRPRLPVVYESLPTHDEGIVPFYQPATPSPFVGINTFKDIVAWNNYLYDVPLLLVNRDNIIVIAGYIEDEDKTYQGRISVDLFSADVTTGQVHWQTIVGNNTITTDGKRVFAETLRETGDIFTPTSLTAYDITSGEILWQTRFELRYAIRISSAALRPPDLVVNTFHRPHSVYYILDPETGEVKERRDRYPFFEEPAYDGLVFSKEGYGRVSPIVAKREGDNSVVWRYEQPVVSNIAVGGPVTYFVTRDAQLIAVDTQTGNVLGRLNFTPGFPEDIHFENDHIIVAADGDLVAVYFRDRRQLSIFRFSPDNLDN